MRALAVWLQKIDPKTDGAARDWVAIYDECSRILYQVRRDLRHQGGLLKGSEAPERALEIPGIVPEVLGLLLRLIWDFMLPN